MAERNQLNIKIATAFAGNLQSNRFLALVSNIDEYKKALEVANDSEGTGTLQFNKTLDNIETRLTKLKTAWQLFYTDSGIEKAIKNVITGLTNILNGLNKLPKAFKKIPVSALMQIAVIIKGVKALALLIVLQIQKAIQQVKNAADNAIKGTSQNAQAQVLTLSEKIKKLKNDWQGMTGVQRGAKIAPYASMIGAGLSIAGSASSNLTAGTVMSGAGSIISGAASGLTMTGSWIGAGVGALVGVIKLISDLSSLEERKAEQKLEELKQAADEAENKRLESKQTVLGLEDYVKQYQEMAKAQYDSNDAKQQFLDLNAEIAEKYPDLLIQYDAEGNKIISLIELQKELNKEKANYGKATRESVVADYNKAKQEYNNKKNNTVDAISNVSLSNEWYRAKDNMKEQSLSEILEKTQVFQDDILKGLLSNDIADLDKALASIGKKEIEQIFDQSSLSAKANIYTLNPSAAYKGIDERVKKYVKALQDRWDFINSGEQEFQQKKKNKSYLMMSDFFHYGDDTFEAYSPIYQSAKSAGFDLDQYISNIIVNYGDETYQALLDNEEAWAAEAQRLAEEFKNNILNNKNTANFVGDIQNKSWDDIFDFKANNNDIYEELLAKTWGPIWDNLMSGINKIQETLVGNSGYEAEYYDGLKKYVTTNNYSLWRNIAENDAEHFEDYYDLVAELAENNQFSIADITNTVLKADLSTMTGIQELENTLKTNGMYQANQEKIEELLKEARSKVKFNPALEFAAMFDTYKKAYEELDKLASSLSTGLELKDAISWATKMGKSINEFTQKEGKFYVSQ